MVGKSDGRITTHKARNTRLHHGHVRTLDGREGGREREREREREIVSCCKSGADKVTEASAATVREGARQLQWCTVLRQHNHDTCFAPHVKLTTDSREVEGGRWKMEGGRWEVEGGRWKVEGGRWKVEERVRHGGMGVQENRTEERNATR
jgi:hypothetical protein